jgi:small multidrug resistance family-3 protein
VAQLVARLVRNEKVRGSNPLSSTELESPLHLKARRREAGFVIPRVRNAFYGSGMDVARSVVLFIVAAVAEIGGAWLVWQGVREHRGLLWAGAGVIALGLYGFVATFQPDPHFGRILAAYGGVFIAGSLLWGMVIDGFRPDRYDVIGALVSLVGVAVIMYSPRAT